MRLLILGACSLLLFWAPLVSPFVQGWTLLEAFLELRRPEAASVPAAAPPRRWQALLAAACALAGLALFLASEYLWIV